jgi:NB-ARC domain
MTVTEILQFIDNLVFTKTNKHLDDIQKRIIEELFKGKTYQQIAHDYHYDEGYIGDLSRNLFKILSEQLGEDINKHNFCWNIERFAHKSFNSKQQVLGLINNHINLCSNHPQNTNKDYPKNDDQKVYHDLAFAPQIINFYQRESELNTLDNWIFNQNTRLISVLGLAGIGKTTLVKRFVDLNLQHFEVTIWKNLQFYKSLKDIITDILTNTSKINSSEVWEFIELLKEKKCLIILDDVHQIFAKGQFAGQYQTEYEDYQTFFTMIKDLEHQSKVILISQEQSSEMFSLNEELSPLKCLEIFGFNDIDILKSTGLKSDDDLLRLIHLYEGHPMYLKDIVTLIKNVFDDEVSEFLAENTLIITENMRSHFHQIFKRISPIEQKIILAMSKNNQPLSKTELQTHLEISSTDLIKGLQSLQQRYLLTKIKEDQTLFKISSVYKEYVRNYCKNQLK